MKLYTIYNIDDQSFTACHTLKEAAQRIMKTGNDASLDGNWLVHEINPETLVTYNVTSDCQIICESIAEEIAQAQAELEVTESALAGGANRY